MRGMMTERRIKVFSNVRHTVGTTNDHLPTIDLPAGTSTGSALVLPQEYVC
jgi:hypothetical protein